MRIIPCVADRSVPDHAWEPEASLCPGGNSCGFYSRMEPSSSDVNTWICICMECVTHVEVLGGCMQKWVKIVRVFVATS